MRENVVSFALSTVVAHLLLSKAYAARPCGNSSAGFQYRLGDMRYDGPDPSKNNGLATIAASLQGSTGTPLFECIGQWPKAWEGWYEDGNKLIWGDCIYTGAGLAQDRTVSFAVDWKKRAMYLAHTFACSDKEGSDGLAIGSISLDLNCTTADDGSFCVPKSPSTGTRPTLTISTTLLPAPLDGTVACIDASTQYQSWRLENWQRRIEMEPGSSPTNPKIVSDSGPSFTLRSLALGGELSCATSGQQNGTFVGACRFADAAARTTGEFSFDPKLNMLVISQQWRCDDSTSFETDGVIFMQASCGRVFNSNMFICTSNPVWIGTGVV
ncbi:hypothetical protein N657DRAFT_581657 [Parathielavia appendiculata]|uniref:Uncharacterized protein n=1 Tax=Parathielavia appendiculata TaxID=2587402 RepID=A0AAN6YZM3_9PEZI|nr:hypothetical protein N657DRAFT_581657 [Parathielavia appendiculata]